MSAKPGLLHTGGSGRPLEEAPKKPVVCLGKTFADSAERRAYFTEELRKKLAERGFRAIEGFPLGNDEDILALSDPPYYTACPNPWLRDFVDEWEKEKKPPECVNETNNNNSINAFNSAANSCRREPFAADVSEGKNDPIYNAHSYHTKVPHKAVMRYILHYTGPGDIVFDGFCGTGMTGVAAQMCGDRAEVESLGYKVTEDGAVLQQETGESGKPGWKPFSRLGARRAVLNDLSPAAAFIAHNYNTPSDVLSFEREARRILAEVETECGWMYETLHEGGETKGRINYTVWSDVFSCPVCSKEVVFWEAAVNKDEGKVLAEFPCPHCGARLTKRRMERAWVNKFDTALNQTIKQAKQIPVLINYTINGRRFEKKPDDCDLTLIEKIETGEIPYWFPTGKIPKGDKTNEALRAGITHVHHFYTRRNLYVLSAVRHRCRSTQSILWFNSQLINISRQNRYRPGVSFPYNPLNGTLYFASQVSESSVFTAYENKLSRMLAAFKKVTRQNAVSTNSTTNLEDIQADYVFIDPPFGSNIEYSELNYVWESWLKVVTNNKHEAVENRTQKKGFNEYRELMYNCFCAVYKLLKPGRWMTVEFSNTRSSIWNAIQTSISQAGFIVANVSFLDKQLGSFNAVTSTTAVRQDLVISAYKPDGGFEERFTKEAGTAEGIWDFARTHLGYLPVVKIQNKTLQPVDERDPRILFDQAVAYYVRKGVQIPIASSQEFQAGLRQRFDERDGMYFLHEQALEYDKKKLAAGGIKQPEISVFNEETAIQWLKTVLKKPQTVQDIYPVYMQKLSGFDKREEKLELKNLLEQNFIQDGSGKWHVPDPENAVHVEKIREKALLKEFEAYKSSARRLKTFRIEAVKAGFKKSYNGRDYQTIIKTAEKLPVGAVEEDPMLLLWYSNARTRLGVE